MMSRFGLLIFLLIPLTAFAQSSASNGAVFSYSIIELDSNDAASSSSVSTDILAAASSLGGRAYASWIAAEKPADAPFAGLAANQLGMMLSWPAGTQQQIAAYNAHLQGMDNIEIISSREFAAIYLPEGLDMPTGKGFYVHREEEYKLDDVATAVRLSQEAWRSWEPHWGVKVIGLFRELGHGPESDNLNRIVWYPDYAAWLETRNFAEDPDSAQRFRQRRTLLVPGSGIAIVTDRLLP